jgi:hypothetical protein
MERLEPVSEAEMVLAFLRAERSSGRQWADFVAQWFDGRWHLLDNPNLADEAENRYRREALAQFRGYGANKWIFAGFPEEVEWWRVRMPRSEVAGLYHARGVWDDLTENTRRVSVAAGNVDRVTHSDDPRVNEGIRAVIRADRGGESFQPLIVASDSPDGRHVLIEGHTRACGFASTLDGPDVEVIAGYAEDLSGWWFWGF